MNHTIKILFVGIICLPTALVAQEKWAKQKITALNLQFDYPPDVVVQTKKINDKPVDGIYNTVYHLVSKSTAISCQIANQYFSHRKNAHHKHVMPNIKKQLLKREQNKWPGSEIQQLPNAYVSTLDAAAYTTEVKAKGEVQFNLSLWTFHRGNLIHIGCRTPVNQFSQSRQDMTRFINSIKISQFNRNQNWAEFKLKDSFDKKWDQWLAAGLLSPNPHRQNVLLEKVGHMSVQEKKRIAQKIKKIYQNKNRVQSFAMLNVLDRLNLPQARQLAEQLVTQNRTIRLLPVDKNTDDQSARKNFNQAVKYFGWAYAMVYYQAVKQTHPKIFKSILQDFSDATFRFGKKNGVLMIMLTQNQTLFRTSKLKSPAHSIGLVPSMNCDHNDCGGNEGITVNILDVQHNAVKIEIQTDYDGRKLKGKMGWIHASSFTTIDDMRVIDRNGRYHGNLFFYIRDHGFKPTGFAYEQGHLRLLAMAYEQAFSFELSKNFASLDNVAFHEKMPNSLPRKPVSAFKIPKTDGFFYGIEKRQKSMLETNTKKASKLKQYSFDSLHGYGFGDFVIINL